MLKNLLVIPFKESGTSVTRSSEGAETLTGDLSTICPEKHQPCALHGPPVHKKCPPLVASAQAKQASHTVSLALAWWSLCLHSFAIPLTLYRHKFAQSLRSVLHQFTAR